MPRASGIVHRIEIGTRIGSDLRIVQRHVQGSLDQAELVSAVEARAFEAIGEHRLLVEQVLDRIGELDLATHAARLVGDLEQHAGRQDVEARHAQA